MLKERQKIILSAAIQEYIKTAKPVASQELVEHFRLGVSPATIRGEMLALDEGGYLEQPHTSAGRVPTDKGYRFFVDNLTRDEFLSAAEEELLLRAFRAKFEAEEFVKEFTRTLSEISGTFCAAGSLEDDLFYETGFGKILEEPEFHEPKEMQTFGHLVDLLDDEVRELFENMPHQKDVEVIYIGKENPMKEAHGYTMVLSSWHHPNGFSGFFTTIGPRRTDYQKQKALMQSIIKIKSMFEL